MVEGQSLPTYALLDSGATTSAISRRLVKKLGLKTRMMDVSLSTFDRKEIVNLETTSFKFQNMEKTLELSIYDALVGNILTSEHEIPCVQAITEGYDYMKDVELHDLKESHVGLLIGARFARHYMGKEIREGGEDEPIAILTDFGWCIAGPISDKNSIVEIAQIDTFDGVKTDIERLLNGSPRCGEA